MLLFLEIHDIGSDMNSRCGIDYICYEIDSLEIVLKDLNSNHNIKPIHPSCIEAHGKPVVFIHPKYTHDVLIELEQV